MNAYPSVIRRKRIGSTAKWPGLREEQAGTSDKSNQQEESTVTRTPVVTPFRPPEPVAAVIPNGLVPPSCRPEVMTITPQIAQEWTSLNTRNRAVRYTKVAQYARDMKAGNWMLNGETVKIAADGTILDGQHRLYACIQADVPFETVVIRGLPPEAQDTIDTGMARKFADQLALRGEVNTPLLGAIARWALRWLRGAKMGGATDLDPTHEEMFALLEADPRIREACTWAVAVRGRFKSVAGSVWGMAWLLFHGSDHLAAEVFLEKVLSGEDCPAGHPALAFRNRIWNAREAGERLTPHEQLAYLIIAWNAFKEDRTLKLVKFPNGKLTVKTFPDVK